MRGFNVDCVTLKRSEDKICRESMHLGEETKDFYTFVKLVTEN